MKFTKLYFFKCAAVIAMFLSPQSTKFHSPPLELGYTATLKFISLLTLAFSFLFYSANSNSLSDNLRFTSIDIIELEKTGIQEAMTQDEQGFMWFGGANGLVRYDGHDVKIYTHDENDPNSLSHSYVRNIYKDSKGRIWVATGYGVNLYVESIDGFKRFIRAGDADAKRRNDFRAIVEDAHGDIWLAAATGLAKLNGSSLSFDTFHWESHVGINIDQISIWALANGVGSKIWLGTRGSGLVSLDTQSGGFEFARDNSGLTRTETFLSILTDELENLWLATEDSGLLRLNPKTGDFTQYLNDSSNPHSLAHNTVWDLFFDADKNLWVAVDDSLEIYDPEIDGFIHYRTLPGTSWTGKVRSIYQSKSGDLWFGMFPSGIAKLDIDATVFKNYQHNPVNPNSLSSSAITAIVEDENKNFWIGTENGLSYYDRKNDTFKRYYFDYSDPYSLPSNAILSLLIDSTGVLWVGTWKGGWARFDAATERFYKPNVYGNSEDHKASQIWTLYEDRQGVLWAGGLYRYDRAADLWTFYKDLYPQGDSIISRYVRDAYEDSKGRFWLATVEGLVQFNRDTGKITLAKFVQNSDKTVKSEPAVVITEDFDSRLLVGTSNAGINVFNQKANSFIPLPAENPILGESIVGIADDGKGNIWMASGSGLIRYSKDARDYQLFDRKNGLAGDLFHRNALIVSSSGEVVFGGGNGLTILRPEELTENKIIPPVVITKLEVLSASVSMKTDSDIIDRPINLADEITLRHDQNVFTLHYSVLNYRLPTLNQYSYMLEGFDTDWMPPGPVRRVTYTNLDPGTYTFRVKGSNNSGLWNEKGATLKVNILPPWWKTSEAYFSYFLLTIFFVAMAFMLISRLREAKNERLLNHQLRQVDHLKDAFMANTSHELRTPLNGIIGLTEWVISEASDKLSDEALKRLNLVVNSGKRLSNIVNDILDFSKLKSHDITLNKSQVNLYELVASTLDVSETLARDKGLVLINDVDKSFPNICADEQRLSQVLYNLIGNAIKFTVLGEVRVSVKQAGKYVELAVSDTGIGISHEDVKRIFLPFEQSIIKSEGKSVGTGLGLAVSKQLIELHGGSVSVYSQVGKGSVFTVSLPFKAEELGVVKRTELSFSDLKQAPKIALLDKSAAPEAKVSTLDDQRIRQARILVVDDEPVNRMVLDGYLRLKYSNIFECANGMEALKLIRSGEHFDVVLLDVMMPGMSGYEVCREIRKLHNELELPVIFLTAKSQAEDLNEGYDAGANDFLFKPVAKDEFLMKVNLHLKSKNIYNTVTSSKARQDRHRSNNS